MSGALGTNLLNILSSSKNVGVKSSVSSDTQSTADSSTGSDFLSTLLGAIDETNEFLPERMQISEKEIYQEFLAKIEQNAFGGFGVGFNESDKGNVFENLSFMQVLGVLENMQIQSTDVKLANLSTQMQDLLQTESNLSALKNISNIDELLSLAKDLNLNVSKIKVDTLLEMKEVFPNLNKNNFFTSKLDGIFKDLINQKIATITKDLPTNSHKNLQTKSESNILSKTFADLEKQSKNTANQSSVSKLFASVDEQVKNTKTAINDDTNLNTQIKQNSPLDTALKQTPEKMILTENEGLNEAHKKANVTANSQEIKDEPKNTNENKISNKLQSQDESPLSSKEKELFKEPSKELNLKENKQENANLNQSKTNVNQANESAKQSTTPQHSTNILQNAPLRQESVNSTLKTEPHKKEAKNEGKFTQNILSENKTQSKENLSVNVSNQSLQNKSVANEFLNQSKMSENSQNLNNLTQNALNSQGSSTTTSNLQNNLTPNSSANLGANSNVSSNATFLQSLLDQALRNDETTKNTATTQEANSQSLSSAGGELDTQTNELNSLVRNLSQTLQNENKNNVTTQQTLNYFSQDLKEQMQQFKAPITRLNITLNPSNLGEVEVTLIQRGNNLHINFNSNTNAMNLFIQNQAEFKNSLVNMGFTGLEMNFSDQSKKEQQQKRQRNSSENFEQEQSFLGTSNESLEIVVPKYF